MVSETRTATTVTMPQLGESVTEGTIGHWLKTVGERVEKYEPLLEVTTDKVNAEVPSPVAGVVTEILVEPETMVPVGASLCRIEVAGGGAAPDGADNGADSDATASEREPAPARRGPGETVDEMTLLRTRSSPVVRRIAAEHGVEIGEVAGTGIGGRVTKRDILAHLDARTDGAAAETAPPPASGPPTPAPEAPPVALEPVARPSTPLWPGDETVPLTPMRRSIAEHMTRSERTAPHVTTVMEVDMTGVVAQRAAAKEAFRQREGIDLSYVPFVIKATTLALRDHPRLNAAWDDERIILRGAINVGVAVALDDGLIVPVIKHADRLSIAGLAHAVAELAAKARDGTLAPDDVAGGTFTVNNPGTFGSLVSTPILVQPQAAILSMEAIVKRPVVIDEMIAIRSLMNLSLSIDHRILDGLAAARFLAQVKAWLETVDDGMALW